DGVDLEAFRPAKVGPAHLLDKDLVAQPVNRSPQFRPRGELCGREDIKHLRTPWSGRDLRAPASHLSCRSCSGDGDRTTRTAAASGGAVSMPGEREQVFRSLGFGTHCDSKSGTAPRHSVIA